MPLITVSDVRTRLGARAGAEAALPGLRDLAVSLWEQRTHRLWEKRAGRVQLIRRSTERSQVIALDLWPVLALTTIRERSLVPGAEWEVLDVEFYLLLHERLIRRLGGTWAELVEVTYDGGVDTATCPADVKEALLIQLDFMLARMSGEKLVSKFHQSAGASSQMEEAFLHPYFAKLAESRRRIS